MFLCGRSFFCHVLYGLASFRGREQLGWHHSQWPWHAYERQPDEEKCCFNQPSLPFLVRVVSVVCPLPDTERIQVIANTPVPRDDSTMCSFLGLLSWYSEFTLLWCNMYDTDWHLLTSKGVGCADLRMSRWFACLMSFNYDHPGKLNLNAKHVYSIVDYMLASL